MEMLQGLLILLILILIYLLPTVIAVQNNHKNRISIGILNLFLGWTFLGWVICLVWAFSKD